jgi:uncharacterized Ntn-hydrolase superfamily protein
MPAALGFGRVRILPLVKLELGDYGFDGRAKLRPQVEGLNGDSCIEFLKVGQVAVGVGHGVFAGAIDVVAQKPAGTEQRSYGVDLRLEALEASLGNLLGEAVEAKQLRGFEIEGHG